MCIFDTKPAISLKQSGLEPKLLECLQELVYRLVTNLVT